MVVPAPQTGMRCALTYFLAKLRDSVGNENRARNVSLVKDDERVTGPGHGSIPTCRNSSPPRNVRILETNFFGKANAASGFLGKKCGLQL
jgi:hypothetical protein